MSNLHERMRAAIDAATSRKLFDQKFEGLTDEEAAAQDADRHPRAMVEMTTEYDWEELPAWLQDVFRHATAELCRWEAMETIKGEVVPAQFEVEA